LFNLIISICKIRVKNHVIDNQQLWTAVKNKPAILWYNGENCIYLTNDKRN